MLKKGKRYKALLEKVDLSKQYSISEAVAIAKECATAKFDESLELHVRLGVDPRHASAGAQHYSPSARDRHKKVCVIALAINRRKRRMQARISSEAKIL